MEHRVLTFESQHTLLGWMDGNGEIHQVQGARRSEVYRVAPSVQTVGAAAAANNNTTATHRCCHCSCCCRLLLSQYSGTLRSIMLYAAMPPVTFLTVLKPFDTRNCCMGAKGGSRHTGQRKTGQVRLTFAEGKAAN